MLFQFLSPLGEVIEYDIPISVEEMKYEKVIDFKKFEQSFFKKNIKDVEAFDKKSEEEKKVLPERKVGLSIPYLIKALSHLIEGDVSQFSHVIEQEELDFLFETRYHLLKDIEGQDDTDYEITIYHIYVHIITCINMYEPKEIPKEFTLEWKGVMYHIQSEEALRYITGTALTAGEVVTVMDFSDKAEKSMKALGGDSDGNIEFNMNLNMFCTLVRPKGHKLPHNDRQRISYIDRQKDIFKDISYANVLDVRFFLIRILNQYIQTLDSSSVSTLPEKESVKRHPRGILRLKQSKETK